MNQRLLHAVMDRYRPGWRNRVSRKKSPWNALGTLLVFVIFLGALIFIVRISLHAEWFSGPMIVPIIFPLFGASMIVSNAVMYTIPPARRVFELEANGNPEMQFKPAMKKLCNLTIKVLLPIGVVVSFTIGLYLNA